MDRYFGAFKWAVELRRKIMKESGLPISLGMSVNKLVSKVTTNEFKPNAEKQIPRGNRKRVSRSSVGRKDPDDRKTNRIVSL